MLSFGDGVRGTMRKTDRTTLYSGSYSRDSSVEGLGNALYHYPLEHDGTGKSESLWL